MTRKMQNCIRERKQEAAELVRFANPRSKRKPSEDHIKELLIQHIPYSYSGGRPTITRLCVMEYTRNRIIKCARFRVDTSTGKAWKIEAYEHLTGRTPQQKEDDKTADFPSGLFTIFHEEIH